MTTRDSGSVARAFVAGAFCLLWPMAVGIFCGCEMPFSDSPSPATATDSSDTAHIASDNLPVPGDTTVVLTSSNYHTIVNEAEYPVMIDFFAVWCGHCKEMSPVVDSLAKEFAGKAFVCKMDAEANPNHANSFRVQAYPTFIFLKDGMEKSRIVGGVSKSELTAGLDGLLDE